MNQAAAASRPFSARANDIRCRDFSARLSRFLRARLQRLCGAGLLLADDPRVWSAWKHGWEGSHYIRLLRWRDEEFHPQVIYDIGAHHGVWSQMAHSIFETQKVILFEPQQAFREKIMSRKPDSASWELVSSALGDKDETQWMHLTENSAASSLLAPTGSSDVPASWGTKPVRREEVKVATLDRLAAENKWPLPDLVKIDVQGFERAVIAGGRKTLALAQRVVIEVSLQTIYSGQALMPEVAHELAGLGFEIDDITEGCRVWPGPVSQVDLWLKRAK